MILIADGGATKTDWRIVDNGHIISEMQTSGYNPYYQSTEEISTDLEQNLKPFIHSYKISDIFYYGSGCSTKERKDTVRLAIRKHINASCEVESDVLGAARAACQHKPGIACILGTGSGSCIFNGEHIIETIPSLGFILGDEGSGAYLGKKLIRDFLREDMPEYLFSAMKEEYQLTKEIVLENVNHKGMPSRYLAGFSKFLHKYLNEDYIYSLVKERLADFLRQYVLRYHTLDRYSVNFVGSIAHYFQSVLKELSAEYNFNLGRVIKSPVEGLVEYHNTKK